MGARSTGGLASSLTLTAGVRADVNRGFESQTGESCSKRRRSAPGLACVWDVGTERRTAIKAHYGRYADSLLLNRIAFLDTAGQHPQIFSVPDGNGRAWKRFVLPSTVSNRLIDDDIPHWYIRPAAWRESNMS